MERGDWSATQFLSNDLYYIAKDIHNHWTSTLGKQVKIKQMRGHSSDLEKCHPGKLNATPCLWHQNVDYCDKMEVQPDCWVKPKKDKAKKFESIIQKVSRLKITERIRFTTIKTFACRTTKPSIGCSWSTAQVAKKITNVNEETVEKAICLILNSTLAKLGMILTRVNRSPSYVQFPIHGLNRVAMPLLSGMKPSAFRALAKVYDEYCKQPRKRLPEAHNCKVQIEIDNAVCQHTDFPEKLCRQARHLLSHEPMITGKRYQSNPESTNPQLPLTSARWNSQRLPKRNTRNRISYFMNKQMDKRNERGGKETRRKKIVQKISQNAISDCRRSIRNPRKKRPMVSKTQLTGLAAPVRPQRRRSHPAR